jgi:hypothetical protein
MNFGSLSKMPVLPLKGVKATASPGDYVELEACDIFKPQLRLFRLTIRRMKDY